MDPLDILKIIRKEIKSTENKDIFKRYDFNRSLIPPKEILFVDGRNKSNKINLWLIFDENTESKSGYQVVYDEKTRKFGLAVRDYQKSTFIGFYGNFVDTFRTI